VSLQLLDHSVLSALDEWSRSVSEGVITASRNCIGTAGARGARNYCCCGCSCRVSATESAILHREHDEAKGGNEEEEDDNQEEVVSSLWCLTVVHLGKKKKE